MPHILLISTSYPTDESGQEAAGSFVSDFALTLANSVRVTILAPALNEHIVKTEKIDIHYFKVPRLPLSQLRPSNPLDWLAIIQSLINGMLATKKVVSINRIDHIFALWTLPSGYWARIIWKKYQIPYSIWALGSDIWTLRKIPIVNKILKKVIQQSSHCFADGHLLCREAEIISGKSFEFLPSSRQLNIKPKNQQANKPPYRLAYLGRWHPNKGVDILLKSLLLLSTDNWTNISEVRIFGGGPLQNLVIQQHKRLIDMNRPVVLGGYLEKSAAAELYHWADYLIIPSRIESIPVVFSDAMQAGCAIIATPVGDLPELLKNFNVGILASSATSNDLKTAILTATTTPPSKFTTGIAHAASQFDINQTTQRFLNNIGLSH